MYGPWILLLYLHVLVKAKFFLITLTNLTDIQRKQENVKWVISVSDSIYTFLKTMFLLFHTALLKFYNGCRVGTLDFPQCNNFCLAYQELDDSFDQEKVIFLWIYLKPNSCSTHKKCNHKKTIVTSASTIAFVTEWTFVGLPNIWILLSFNTFSKGLCLGYAPAVQPHPTVPLSR